MNRFVVLLLLSVGGFTILSPLGESNISEKNALVAEINHAFVCYPKENTPENQESKIMVEYGIYGDKPGTVYVTNYSENGMEVNLFQCQVTNEMNKIWDSGDGQIQLVCPKYNQLKENSGETIKVELNHQLDAESYDGYMKIMSSEKEAVKKEVSMKCSDIQL